MNKKIFFFGWLFLSVLAPELAVSGAIKTIHVDWSYSGSAVRYILYKDGVQSCFSNDPNAMQMDCTVEIGETPMTFTLTAVDAAGIESPQSAPYTLVPPAIDPVTGNYFPQANFTATAISGSAPLLVSFDASESGDQDGIIVSYEWDFGDGGADSGELIDYTFVTPGVYTVTLTVVDDEGASAQKIATITVSAQAPPQNNPPIAVIEATLLQSGTSQLRFNASTSSDPDGTIVSYAWNFGDGETAVGSQVEHEFLAAGDYTVVLTVTDNLGVSSHDQIIITIVDSPKPANTLPIAFISASNQQRLVHLEWGYAGTDPGLAGFRFYQNGRLACETANPAARQTDCLTYIDNGTVRFTITSYDQTGTESVASSNMTFDNTGLYQEAGGDAPLLVHFTPGASADPDGTITSYAWDFGDGETATTMETDHLFTAAGNYTVTLTATDNNGGQTQATTIVKVTSSHPPTAISASFSTAQDKSVTATLSASDPDGSPLTFRVIKAASLGTATITDTAKGVFTYVPKLGVSGEDSFTFKANDGTFDSNEAVVSIAIQKSNSAPTTTDQTLAVLENGVTSGTLTAMDADNDPMTFSLVSLPMHGTATITNTSTGAFSYTPSANVSGSDSFSFKTNDGKLDSAIATVSVSIAAVNHAPTAANASLAATEDLVASGKLSGADPDGDALTFSIVTNGTKGKAVVTDPATGAFSYTPSANVSGSDSFSFKANDSKLDSAIATVSVSIAAVNHAPTAANASLAATEDLVASGKLSGADPDGDTMTFSIVTNGTKGKAVVTDPATGAFSYTPSANVSGSDSFSFKVNDGKLDSAIATVSVSIAAVNHAPTAANASLAATEDLVASGKLSGADSDGDALTFSIVTNGTKGKAVVTDPATGAFSYTPSANVSGSDSFSFKVNDSKLDSAIATVSVSIAPVNHAPTAANASLAATEDLVASGKLSGADPDGDTMTFSIVTNGTKGKAVVTDPATGAFSYTPSANVSGSDSFTFKTNDSKLDSAPATVSVSIAAVNDAPTAANASLAATEDLVASGKLSGADPDGDTMTFSIVTNGTKGKAVVTDPATGAFSYTPSANVSGSDSFSFKVNDGKLDSAIATVSVSIAAVNHAPTAANASLAATEDLVASGKLSGADPDGDTMTFSIVTNGTKGKAVVTDPATGAFSYTPSANVSGTDSFTFKVTDSKLDSAPATVSVSIAAVNDAPTAANASLAATEDLVASGKLSGADSDGDALTFSIVTNGTKGKAVVTDPATGAFSYTPSANASGTDSFTFKVNDGKLDSAIATASVSIAPANDAPTTTNLSLWATENLVASGLLSGSDPDGDSLTFSIITNGTKGKAVVTDPATGAFSYTPSANVSGSDSFTFKVNDGKLDSAIATVSVSIAPVNHVPTTTNLSLWATENLVASGLLSGSDPDGDTLTFSIVTNGTKGKAVVTDPATGAFSYTPSANVSGNDSFTFKVNDDKLDSAIATVSVSIAPINHAPTANADFAQAKRGRSVLIPVRANDSDGDGDLLTLVSVNIPRYGKATISKGSVTYTANRTFVGKISFSYHISDGNGGAATGTVTVTVVR